MRSLQLDRCGMFQSQKNMRILHEICTDNIVSNNWTPWAEQIIKNKFARIMHASSALFWDPVPNPGRQKSAMEQWSPAPVWHGDDVTCK